MSTDARRLATALTALAEHDSSNAQVVQVEVAKLRDESARYRNKLRQFESGAGSFATARFQQVAHLRRAVLATIADQLRGVERTSGLELPPVVRDLERSIGPFLAVYGRAGTDNTTEGGNT